MKIKTEKNNRSASLRVNKKTHKKICTRTDDVFQGIPLKKPVARKVVGNVEIAEIPKKNLNIAESQRDLQEKRVENMRESWNEALGVIHASESKEKNGYNYYVPDGQHRAYANPNEACVCIIHKEDPHIIFLKANDPSTCKSLTWDDRFWANLYGGEKKAIELFEKLSAKGLCSQRINRSKEGDFSGIGNIFKILLNIKATPKKRGRKSEQQKIQDERRSQEEKIKRFDYLLELVFSLFDPKDFQKSNKQELKGSTSGYQTIWSSFATFINNNTVWSQLPKSNKQGVKNFKQNFRNECGMKLTPTSLCGHASSEVTQSKYARDIIVDMLKAAFQIETKTKKGLL